VVNTLLGFDSADAYMKKLLHATALLIRPSASVSLRDVGLKLLLSLLTLTDNINQNALLEYFMLHPVFDQLTELIRMKDLREQHGFTALCVLAILINYRKHEAPNPYVNGMAEIKDEVLLCGIGSVIVRSLLDRNQHWLNEAVPKAEGGFFRAFGRMVENLFVGEEEAHAVRASVAKSGAALLALYETVQLNTRFHTVLTHTLMMEQPILAAGSSSDAGAAANAMVPSSLEAPASLLSTFFTFMSFIIQDGKDQEGMAYTKLFFIILCCIIEDKLSNAFLHDPNVNIPVVLHKAAMRHRHSSVETVKTGPMACPLLELCIEFLISHLKKNLSIDLYSKCLSVVHCMLCYQKLHRIRLQFNWKELWDALVGLVKYILSSERLLSSHENVLGLADQVVTILNLFITYGDTFLPDPSSYDELYYELIRVHSTFDSLYDIAKRQMWLSGLGQAVGAKLSSSLVNIRSITSHFAPKIEMIFARSGGNLTPDQVLAVVRDNYDSLTLKLQDNLDHYEKYAENPHELSFFTNVVRLVIQANRDVHIGIRQIKVLGPT
jgi:hypothetical protein